MIEIIGWLVLSSVRGGLEAFVPALIAGFIAAVVWMGVWFHLSPFTLSFGVAQ